MPQLTPEQALTILNVVVAVKRSHIQVPTTFYRHTVRLPKLAALPRQGIEGIGIRSRSSAVGAKRRHGTEADRFRTPRLRPRKGLALVRAIA